MRNKGRPIEIVHANGEYRICVNGRPLEIRLSNGTRVGVRFKTKTAAAGYVRWYEVLERLK